MNQPGPFWPEDVRYLRIGGLIVDLNYRRILHADGDAELQQRIFDLLLLFIAEPHVLHSRADLFQRLWPDVIVDDANLSQNIWLLRKALGDERRSWVRTVAKGGYVFEPPEAVEPLTELPVVTVAADADAGAVVDVSSAVAVHAADVMTPPGTGDGGLATRLEPARGHGEAIMATPGPARRGRDLRGWAAATAIVAAFAIWWSGTGTDKGRDGVIAASPPLAVALIEVEDPANAVRWPLKLLHDWLRWKLDSLPDVALLREADLATYSGSVPSKVVFLSSSRAPDDADQIVLLARFDEAGEVRRIELKGSASQVPAMADELSRQVMSRLLPGRADTWPALALDVPAAHRYADVVDAYDRRDWMTVAGVAAEVVELAPRFGLARLRLAQAQMRLAQASSAIGQMDAALSLLQPLPDDAREVLKAQRLEADPQRKAQAAEAFGALAARHPGKLQYALAHANMLAQSGHLHQALAVLQSHDWEREPTGSRIAYRLGLADIHRMLGDPARAGEHARAAEHLASAAGDGWGLERGAAMLLAALVDTPQHAGHDGTAHLYEGAAKQMEMAGNQTGALYARFLAETAAPPDSRTVPRLEAMLVQARAGGYIKLEIGILARVAGQHYVAGDVTMFRRLMEQAMLVARTSGDVLAGNELGMIVATEDFLGARFSSVDALLSDLHEADMQGAIGLTVEQTTAGVQALRGNYARALETLDRAESQLAGATPGAPITELHARLFCARAGTRLPLGDLVGARADWARCATSRQPPLQMLAALGNAESELLAGDRDGAMALLEQAAAIDATLPDGPDRWTLSITLASLLTRAGDLPASERLYSQTLDRLHGTGYDLLTAAIDIGMAENAAARGDWSASHRHATAVRRILPGDLWGLIHRLDLLDIAAAGVAGDQRQVASLAATAHARAHGFGDVVANMQIHSLLPLQSIEENCGSAHGEELAARSGMRGATLAWLRTSPDMKATHQAKREALQALR